MADSIADLAAEREQAEAEDKERRERKEKVNVFLFDGARLR